MRFRKERSFVYPLVAADEELASPPLEQIALAQVALGGAVGRALPAHPGARRSSRSSRAGCYRRHENRLVRAERWGLPEGGLTSTLNRAEMPNAAAHPEPQPVLARGRRRRRPRAGLQAARRRRPGPPRREPPAPPLDARPPATSTAAASRTRLGPLLPSPRALVSAAEAAHLLALPSARMKGVPVRRLTLPRIPAPPEVLRADRPRPGRRAARRRAQPPRAPTPATSPRAHDAPRTGRSPTALLPVLRAENGEVLIHPDDRKYGALLVGGQGWARPRRCCGATSTTCATPTRRRSSSTPRASSAGCACGSRRPTAASASGSSTSATRRSG